MFTIGMASGSIEGIMTLLADRGPDRRRRCWRVEVEVGSGEGQLGAGLGVRPAVQGSALSKIQVALIHDYKLKGILAK